MGQKEIAGKVKEITDGIVGSAVDLALLSIYFSFEFATSGYSSRGWKADEKALNTLSELNYQTIKRSYRRLKQKGMIKITKQKISEELIFPQITKEGKKRLESIIPQYQETRTWDDRVYIITYDLPVERNNDRDKLRNYLKKIGCGLLQKSVWITPYNPKGLIKKFVDKNKLGDELVLVSSLQKDGSVGIMSLPDLLERVYKLSDLNERYIDFISLTESERLTREQAIFSYLSILKDDPQIPFKLLPYDWKGDKAYQFFKRICDMQNNLIALED